ncbi:MAG TPA: PilZ domain-containing protein [Stellaceae bacterium]|nr:PilZ domain-containing protein [Stellaceae bacterium]
MEPNIRRLRRPESDDSAPGRRWKTDWPAELGTPQGRQNCVVLDISSWGARLRLDAAAAVPEHVWLVLDSVGAIAANLIWRRDDMLGLQFLEQQAWIRRLYARRLDPLAWPPAGGSQPHP